MKTVLLMRTGICSLFFVLLMLTSCTKQEEAKFFTQQGVLDLMSDQIGVSSSHMTMTVMPSTALGKFQNDELVNESILADGNFALVLIDQSAHIPGYYEFVSFPNSISDSEVDFIMLMSVENNVRSRIVTGDTYSKKARKPKGPIVVGTPTIPTGPRLGMHCAGVGVCVMLKGGTDNCSYGKACGALEDFPIVTGPQ